MSSDALLILLTIFVGLTTISFIAQAIAIFKVASIAKKLEDRVNGFLPKAEALVKSAEETLTDSRDKIQHITKTANEVLDLTRTQLHKVDDLMTDVSSRARTQMDKVEYVMDDTLNRVHSTVSSVHGGLLKPVREITGVAAGLKTAMAQLFKGSPANVSQVTADEEMFI